ncbi:MAG: hypothetical protein QXS21_06005 [Thermoproteota archaeon]
MQEEQIKIGKEISIDEIQKKKRTYGVTAKMEEIVSKLPVGKAIPFYFESKGVMGGKWKTFKAKGYFVSTAKEVIDGKTYYVLYIGKTTK